MNLVADESVDRPIVERLRMEAHQVLYVAEMAPGITDELVLSEANQQQSVLLTADKDFGELVVLQHRITTGVVLLRLEGLQAQTKMERVSLVMRDHAAELAGAFTVVSPGGIRIRPLNYAAD